VPAGTARIEVTAPRGRKPREGILVHRSRVIHPEDVATVEAIPVTSVSRTLVDFADVADEPRVERAVNEAELRGLFDLRAVERAIERLPNRVGRGRLRRALEAFYPEPAFTRSEGERRFVRVCRDHGLPPPSANLWVAGHEVDLIWPDAGIVVEIDGAATHRTTLAFHRDRRRDRELAAHGLQVVRLTGRDLSDPTALAADMRAVRACRLQEPGRVRATPRAP
jgi:hypothetical protein